MARLQGSWKRRRWSGETPVAAVPERAGSDPHEATVERELLRQALLTLPVRQRQTVVLRYHEDLSIAEVAEILDCSPNTVKSQSTKGVLKLRQALGLQRDQEKTP